MAQEMKCPKCESKMHLYQRVRPEGGAMFVGDDMWVCPKCLHSQHAEADE